MKILEQIVITILCVAFFFSQALANDLDEKTEYLKQMHGDLPVLLKDRSIRVLVPFDNISFFMNKGHQDGLYVALMNKFKKFLERRHREYKGIKFYFIPVRTDQMVKMVADGYGDIAMGIEPTDDFRRFVDFSIPEKLWIKEIIAVRKGTLPINSIRDLSGVYVTVKKSSRSYESLKVVNVYLKAMQLPEMHIIKADEYLSDADLVDMVNRGEIQATVVNNYKLTLWRDLFPNVTFAEKVPVRTDGTLAWAIRHDSKELYREVNLFLRSYRDGTEWGTPIYDHYMRTRPTYRSRYVSKHRNFMGIKSKDFVRYSNVFKKYATKFDLNWLLIMAQAYQESTLNPEARSAQGAVGIMQVLPSTANEWYVNVHSVHDVDNNVHAGTKYLRFLMDNYFNINGITSREQLFFAMASYNGGPGRILKYRKEAEKQGLNPNEWFNNVEIIAMAHGAMETVKYVRNIFSLYVSYSNMYKLQHEKELQNRRETRHTLTMNKIK